MIRTVGTMAFLALATAVPLQQASAQDVLGGALLGGAAGAIIGGAATGRGEGAAIGAMIGAGAGLPSRPRASAAAAIIGTTAAAGCVIRTAVFNASPAVIAANALFAVEFAAGPLCGRAAGRPGIGPFFHEAT